MMATGGRLEIIQAVRFLAAALVVVTHITLYISERFNESVRVWHFGEVGVPVFFVISGFVMALVAAKIRSFGIASSAAFLRDRFVRIVPMYWAATFLKAGIALAFPATVLHNHFDFTLLFKSLFFVPYFNDVFQIRPLHGVGWTLVHEVFFYLTVAVFILVSRRPAFATGIFVFSLSVAGFFVDVLTPFQALVLSSYNFYFVFGIFSYFARQSSVGVVKFLCVSVALGSLVIGGASHWVVVTVVLCLIFVDKFSSFHVPKSLRSLGDGSYSLYLFHPFVAPAIVVVCSKLLEPSMWVLVAIVSFLFSVFLCQLVHLFFERPVIAWIKAFLERKNVSTSFSNK